MEYNCAFGIDVSKASMNVAILVNKHQVDAVILPMNQQGFSSLKAKLASFKQPIVVFEATGIYSRRLKFFLDSQRINYVYLNPLRAKKQLDKLRSFKSDQVDAFRLAETQFILSRKPSYKMDPAYQELMDMSRFYQELVKDSIAHKNRLHRVLQLTFPELEQVESQPSGNFYWYLVEHYANPQKVCQSSPDQILNSIPVQVKKSFFLSNQRLSRIIERLVKLARQAYPVVTEHSYVYHQISYLARQLKTENQMKNKIIKQMIQLAKGFKEYDELLSIPGFGKETVVSLIGELGDLRRFRSSNALNAFVGIDLRHYESGNYVAADRISKRGNPIARKILFKSIQSIASAAHYHPNHINDFYQKRKKQFSLSSGTKKIAIATMHRLLRTMYHLVKYDQFYDYDIARS